MRCHVNHSTASSGKQDSEKFVTEFLNPAGLEFSGCILGTVGCADRAAAHVSYWNGLGFSENRMLMVDNDSQTFFGLSDWAHQTGFKGRVICGDLLKVIPDLCSKSVDLNLVDADVQTRFGTLEIGLVELALRHRIPRMALTFTQRGHIDPRIREIYRAKPHHKLEVLVQDVLKFELRNAPQYAVSECKSYRGTGRVCPM